MFALVDCNNFYVSCERLFDPTLKGRPVVVLSNNDGCVISRSDEAKALGVEMAAPAFLVKDLIDLHHMAVFSSNYTLYGDMSQRVMHTLREFAPRIEEYSIDEAFLDLSGLPQQEFTQLARQIRNQVIRATGIPVSIGVAPTKTLAKMANRFAKKTKQAAGVHCLNTDRCREEVLRYTEIGEVWGIGRQHSKRLTEMNIHTAYDLLQMNDDWMRTHMTVMGQRLLNELKGIPCIPLEEKPAAKKNICTSRSFGQLLTDVVDIKEAVANFAARCAAKLRSEKSCASALQVFLHTNVHRQRDRQYSSSITIPLEVASNNTQELIFYALCGINKIYKPGYKYVKAGVMVHEIVPEGEVQQGLFDLKDRVKENYLIETVDKINRSWGRDLVKYAVQGSGEKWKLRRQKLSLCYTTRLDDVVTINI